MIKSDMQEHFPDQLNTASVQTLNKKPNSYQSESPASGSWKPGCQLSTPVLGIICRHQVNTSQGYRPNDILQSPHIT